MINGGRLGKSQCLLAFVITTKVKILAILVQAAVDPDCMPRRIVYFVAHRILSKAEYLCRGMLVYCIVYI